MTIRFSFYDKDPIYLKAEKVFKQVIALNDYYNKKVFLSKNLTLTEIIQLKQELTRKKTLNKISYLSSPL